jgi:hypothetical protein
MFHLAQEQTKEKLAGGTPAAPAAAAAPEPLAAA